MYGCSEVRFLHLEVTTRCNAACPMCSRNINGGREAPGLPKAELSLQDVQAFFPEEFIRQLRKVYLCGNYGDPAVAKDTLEILRHFRAINPLLNIGLHTNGSMRTPEWWHELGKTVNFCRFGIDGLEDTNHLYRRRTDWRRIMANVEAFIAAGSGAAEWDYLVFRHNEHQIEAARVLAERMGFRRFQTKKTSRFANDGSGRPATRMAVERIDGQFDYWLEMPFDPQYINDSFERTERLAAEYGSYVSYLDQVEIECKVAKEKNLFVSAEGHVFPCCWTALQWHSTSKKPHDRQIRAMVEALPEGARSIDLRAHSLEEILSGAFFQTRIPESWGLGALDQGKLKVCSRICAAGNDPFLSQFSKPLSVGCVSLQRKCE